MWHCLAVTWYCGIKIELVFIWRLRDKLTEGGSHELLAVSWRCWRLVADIDGYLTGIWRVFYAYLKVIWHVLDVASSYSSILNYGMSAYLRGVSWDFMGIHLFFLLNLSISASGDNTETLYRTLNYLTAISTIILQFCPYNSSCIICNILVQ